MAVNWDQVQVRARRYERLHRVWDARSKLLTKQALLQKKVEEYQRELDGMEQLLVKMETDAGAALNELDRMGQGAGSG